MSRRERGPRGHAIVAATIGRGRGLAVDGAAASGGSAVVSAAIGPGPESSGNAFATSATAAAAAATVVATVGDVTVDAGVSGFFASSGFFVGGSSIFKSFLTFSISVFAGFLSFNFLISLIKFSCRLASSA